MTYKEQLKKISDYEYELPKTGQMLVPGKIFASAKLMEKIEDDAIKQVANVACLPGIYKYSLAMPDLHTGYGFGIGGVAALDYEKGGISPGGIGYDINCLTGDTRILTEFGTSLKIEEFNDYKSEMEIEQNNQILKKIIFSEKLQTLNVNSKEIENKPVEFFMSRDSSKVYEVILNSGLKIKATSEHPFLTKNGMKALDKIGNEEIALNLFEGIEYNKNINKNGAILAKIIGYMFGDGCTYESNGRLFSAIYGTEEDLKKIKEDLAEINVNSRIYARERNHKIDTKYGKKEFSAVNYELHIHSKEFNTLLKEKGMPLGNKTRQEVKIPKWIKESSRVIKRLFLAGFFGAEMSSPKTSSKTCFFCPTISQNKIESLKQNCRDFLIAIGLMLEEFGIKDYSISDFADFKNQYNENTVTTRLFIKGEDNMLKLWRTIGFEYNKKRIELANIASLYILLKKSENAKRHEIAEKVKDYKKKGLTLKEVQKIFSNQINGRFIERHYYAKAGQRINLDFLSFNDFCNIKKKELISFGAIFDSIKEIKKLEGNYKVYDFNIRDNHNFIANSFIVSNCGVRLLRTNLKKDEIYPKIKELLESLFKHTPAGLGSSNIRVSKEQIKSILENGAKWAVENKYGTKEDLEFCEENGNMKGANADYISEHAKDRGFKQVATLGSGNHFLEVQYVDEIYDKEAAEAFGIEKGQVVLMIHCGSRGLGHQVCSDYLREMEKTFPEIVEKLPDRELIYAPAEHPLAKKYFSAMAAAANFAWCNRHIIGHQCRIAFSEIFPKSKLETVYDVAHNIAKIEAHNIDGKDTKVYMHRKGATRAFGPGNPEIPKAYQKVGQPIILPGSMGTASYILVGTKRAEEISFASTAHGAGREMSRHEALRHYTGEGIKKDLESRKIFIKAASWKGIAEEAPGAYKDVDEVVEVSHKVGIGNKVARLKPIGVIKG